MTTAAHVAALAAGLAIITVVHLDVAIILNSGLFKRACLAIGLAVGAAFLMTAARALG